MTVSSLWRQLHGHNAFLLAVEGLPDAYSDKIGGTWTFVAPGPEDPPAPEDWTVIGGVLQREDLVHSQSVSLDTCELKASDLTFRLVDGEGSDGTRYVISKRMSREGAAARTYLTATFAVGDTDMDVQSTAAFPPDDPAGMPAFIGLETVLYFPKVAAQFQSCTRAMWGSRERTHTFALPGAVATVADYGQAPEVTDRPTSWMGRRCWVYEAEVNEDGTLQAAEIVWRGRITGELEANKDMEWVVPAESLPSAMSTDLLGSQPSTVVQGIYLNAATTLDYELTEEIGQVDRGTGTFTVDAGTYRIGDLLDHITDRLNASLDAGGLTDDRWQLFEEGGRIRGQKVRDDAAPCFIDIFSLAANVDDQEQPDPIAMVLGITRGSEGRLGNGELFHPGVPLRLVSIIEDGAGNPYVKNVGPAPVALFVGGTEPFWVPVENVSGFAAFRDDDEAENWHVQSVVTIDGAPFVLLNVNATDRLMQVVTFTDHVESASAWAVQYANSSPVEVRQGLWVWGDLPLLWRDAVLDNANVPPEMVVGADSRDFDWVDLEAQFPGGNISRRDRLLTGPVSLAELIVEDFAHAGLAPILGLNGLITARPINNTSLVRHDGEALLSIDDDTIDSEARPEVSRSPKRVVNRYIVHITREIGRPGIPNAGVLDLEAIVNDKDSQNAKRMVRSVERDFSGAANSNVADMVADVYGVAGTLFALLSREVDILPVGPCNGIAHGVLPLDTVLVTHWMPPDPTNSGERGLVALPALVLGVEYDRCACAVSMDLQLLVDNGQRSGFAPAARLIAYTDNGAPAGARRHEVSIDVARYCPADLEEGTFFKVGWKVVIRQWDTDSITEATAAFSLTDVDTDALFLSAAPTAGMQAEINAGRALCTLNRYDTAGQASLALLYLHVADDVDDLIGASGVLGFHVS